jgi:ribosome-associated heat shock protein Hsp15
MDNSQQTRIDKWLWMVRIYKTRSLSTEACRKGKVLLNGNEAKASKEIKEGDTISVKKPPVQYSFLIKGIPKNRVGAKLLPDYLDDTTPDEELEKLNVGLMAFHGYRERGTGRPTKKERRTLDEIRNLAFDDQDD